jgi:hypothetical protein
MAFLPDCWIGGGWKAKARWGVGDVSPSLNTHMVESPIQRIGLYSIYHNLLHGERFSREKKLEI